MRRKLTRSNSGNSLARGERAVEALKQRFNSSSRAAKARPAAALFEGLAPDEAFDRLPNLIVAADDLLAAIADYADVDAAIERLQATPGAEVVASRKPDRRNLSGHDRAAMDLLVAISLRLEALRVLQRAIVQLTDGRTTGGKINDSTASQLVGAVAKNWRKRSGEDLGGEFLDHIQGIDSSEPSELRERLDRMIH